MVSTTGGVSLEQRACTAVIWISLSSASFFWSRFFQGLVLRRYPLRLAHRGYARCFCLACDHLRNFELRRSLRAVHFSMSKRHQQVLLLPIEQGLGWIGYRIMRHSHIQLMRCRPSEQKSCHLKTRDAWLGRSFRTRCQYPLTLWCNRRLLG